MATFNLASGFQLITE